MNRVLTFSGDKKSYNAIRQCFFLRQLPSYSCLPRDYQNVLLDLVSHLLILFFRLSVHALAFFFRFVSQPTTRKRILICSCYDRCHYPAFCLVLALIVPLHLPNSSPKGVRSVGSFRQKITKTYNATT